MPFRKKSKSYALDRAVSQLPLVMAANKKKANPTKVEVVKERPSLPPPQEGPQTDFYNSKADVTFFGGSAGGGKSFGLLLSIAKQEYLDANGYNAVIFRRSRPDLTNEGGIWDTANQLFPDIDGESNGTYLYYKFPPYDNRIRFSQLQHEKSVYRWKSSQITSLNFEELTEFSWSMFSYMLSRNRSNCGIKPSVRATMNPDADSWIAKFIEWYIGDDGYIIPERSGVIRYFLIKDNEPIWGDSLDDLMESFGDELTEMADDVNKATGEDLVKPQDFIKSFTFIKADVFDNPALLRTNPEYLANLKAQHTVESERLLKGNWKIKYDSGNVFNRAWLHVVEELPDFNRCRQVYKVRAWDLAASTKEANKKAFYTCGVLMYLIMEFDQDYFTYYVADMQAEQLDPVAGDDFIVAIANQDGTGIPIRVEQEGGSSGPKWVSHMHSRLSGYDFEGVRPMGDKLVRFIPFASDAKNGRVRLVRGDWNHQYLSWLHSFEGTAVPGITDCADATSGCHTYLSQFDQVNALGWLSSV